MEEKDEDAAPVPFDLFTERFEDVKFLGVARANFISTPREPSPFNDLLKAFEPHCRQPGCGRPIRYSPIAGHWWHADNGAHHCYSSEWRAVRAVADALTVAWDVVAPIAGRWPEEDPDRCATDVVTYRFELRDISPSLVDLLLDHAADSREMRIWYGFDVARDGATPIIFDSGVS